MADVRLDFVKPEIPDLVKLHIYESDTQLGVFNPIEEVTAIGTYPNYISYYTTELAGDESHWFAIEWEDSKGAMFGISQAVQGNVQTVVGEVVSRALLRDPIFNEMIVTQEALAVIETYFKTDPLSVDFSTVTYSELSGLTLLTMVRSYIFTSVSQSSEDYTAGLVSQKSSSGTRKDLDALLAQANAFLGTNFSVVMVMEEIEIAGGTAGEVTVDQTRLLVEFP